MKRVNQETISFVDGGKHHIPKLETLHGSLPGAVDDGDGISVIYNFPQANAVDMWEPLKRSLGKKRREISKDQIDLITEVYAAFAPGSKTLYSEKRKADCKIECRIFDREEFMYKEWAVYQPLQRRGVINAESIETLRTSAYFTANSNLYNESELAELEETNPRDAKAEKKYQKYKRGKVFIDAVLAALESHQSDEIYMDFALFQAAVKDIIDRKGNILTDPTTKDTEIIRLNQDVQTYFDAEVLPHVPDAIWAYEFDPKKAVNAQNRERLGAEFPFTRYFYEYKAPESADDLLAQFVDIEKELSRKIADLTGGAQ